MAEVDVRLERVSKLFGDVAAVDDLSLDIDEGEFFSMLGPSGCGKTTTLRMIGGFEDPTMGTVYLGGRDVTDDPPYKRDVNTVFQSYALFPHLNVKENVAFGLRRKKVDDDEIETRVKEIMDLVDLVGFEDRKPPQMSGGQQQRVALARALVNHPKVLLLDEPLGALDLKLRKQMQLELKRIQQEVGITFIYVTHDQEEAMTMSNRLAVMRHGPDRAARRARVRLREPGDRVRRRVPRRLEPPRGRACRAPRTATGTVALEGGGTVTLPTVADPVGRHRRREGRGPAREDHDRPRRRRGAVGDERRDRHGHDVDLHRRLAPVQGRHARAAPRFTVYVQNLGADEAPAQGETVRLSWEPEHTFAVAPQEGLSLEEEDE